MDRLAESCARCCILLLLAQAAFFGRRRAPRSPASSMIDKILFPRPALFVPVLVSLALCPLGVDAFDFDCR